MDRIGINNYRYITKFKDVDAINTTCNLLGLTSPLISHTLSAAGRSWQEEVKQDGIRLIRTCESPPPISTLDQAPDESKSMYKEQFGATHGGNPRMVTRLLKNTVEKIGIDYYRYIAKSKDRDATNTTCN